MKSIAPVLRFRSARRATSAGRLALVLVLALATVLGGAPAVRADGPLTRLTSRALGYKAHDLILEGNFAYVATEQGLTILDISDPNPNNPPVVRGSELSTNANRAQGLGKKGNFVYLAVGKAGMQVIDVSNVDDPRTVATVWKGGNIFDVAVHPTGNAAYAVSYNGELYVWNIANPAAPVHTQTLGIRHWRGVCDSCVEDMRNEAPSGGAQSTGVSVAVGIDPLGNPRSVVSAVDWNYGGQYLWDSSNPLHLTFLGTHRAPVSFRSEVDVARDVIYILGTYSKTSGVHTVDLSFVIANEVTYIPGGYRSPDWATCPSCGFVKSAYGLDGGGIGFAGKYVFYAGGKGNGELAIIDATDPAHMVKVASQPLGATYHAVPQAMGLAARRVVDANGVTRDLLYVAAAMLGVVVYEYPGLLNPAPPAP